MPDLGSRRRPAFTLIELLVVIAIIAILLGLLLSAVQRVRESAARTKCQNNLKQIALGAHLYQNTYKRLPAGWATTTATQPSPGWSWASIILPYIEQGTLYGPNGANVDPLGNTGSTVNAYTTVKIALYRCPSDIAPDLNGNYQGFATSNYVCNREVLGPDASNHPAPLTLEKIRDGASNTFLFGEREGVVNLAAVWVKSSVSTSSFEGRPGYAINPQPVSPATSFTTRSAERLAYSSSHPGGSQFAMGDGRVIFLINAVDADPTDLHTNFPAHNTNYTLQKLQHPNDKLPVVIP
ncbi:MAG TPA: DUF1559 domain-containing protein [Urbifossiella sp.]|nr:DUF1559 domain-containing protein [Urbifossiella sp.]